MKTKIPSFPIVLLLACLEFSPTAYAVDPPPDGGYPGGNTAEGHDALLSLTTGGSNTAVGMSALQKNTEGNLNTAIGAGALFNNILAFENTAVGAGALLNNAPPFVMNGRRNTATGAFALYNNRTGSLNTAVGNRSLFNSTSGGSNIALGANAGRGITTANNVICIGSDGDNINHSCFIGNIRGEQPTHGNTIPVLIDSAGQLGTASSSRRFKKEIKPMDKASEAILALKPVTFHYKGDNSGTPQFGLIAEDVATVDPNLVIRDEKNEIYTVRYDAVNAMLLNEFLKEHRKVEQQERKIQEQETTIAQLKKATETVVARLKEQAAKIQRVSAQLQMSGSESRVLVVESQ